MFWDKARTENVGSLDASGANTVAYAPATPIHVKRLVFITTTAHTTADATLTVAVRDVDNGNSTTIGTITVPFTGSAADDVAYANIAERAEGPDTVAGSEGYPPQGIGSTVTYGSGDGDVLVNPGQELSITSDGGGDAGTYEVYIEFVPTGFQETADYVTRKLTFTAA